MRLVSFLATFLIAFGTMRVMQEVTDNIWLSIGAVVAVGAYGMLQRYIGYDESEHPERY